MDASTNPSIAAAPAEPTAQASTAKDEPSTPQTVPDASSDQGSTSKQDDTPKANLSVAPPRARGETTEEKRERKQSECIEDAVADMKKQEGDESTMTAEWVPPEWYTYKTVATPTVKLTPIADIPAELNIKDHDMALLNKSHHDDPFSVLGPHKIGDRLVVRSWIKDAREMRMKITSGTPYTSEVEWIPMIERADWCFQIAFEAEAQGEWLSADFKYTLQVKYNGGGDEWHERSDAYNFGMCCSDFDLEMFKSGHCWHVDNILGSHPITYHGVDGYRFSVWAPNARFVSIIGDWNEWDGRAHPMRKRHEYGVWELFIPTVVCPAQKYRYKIHTRAGTDITKVDPFAQAYSNPPMHDSMINDCDDPFKPKDQRFQWTDDEWCAKRAEAGRKERHDVEHISRQPMSIYEVHLPSWMRGDDNAYLSYTDIADPLIAHVKTMHFTHVEFMPLSHHPFEGSWGYQVTGNYAPYSRLGSADDLKYLIDKLHGAGIGVFVDIVPAHFAKDDWGLARFDGEPLFEYADPREGEIAGWGTYQYNYKRSEVRSYVLGSVYHWIRRYHIDGLRVDAVSAMIYKNHCRDDWIPNEHGGDGNIEAMTLLREMNWVVHQNCPGVFMMAEESTDWPGVTLKTDSPTSLGFDAKWDLGWMNDTMAYTTSPNKQEKHGKLNFRAMYQANESWILPLSHDECVSGKGSILSKMGFEDVAFIDKLATLRAILAFQVASCGRPLLMMGAEFGQGREWSEKRSLDWHESQEECRSKNMLWLSDLLKMYKDLPALYAGDDEPWNFKWNIADDNDNNVLAFTRKFGDWTNDVLFIANFSGVKKYRYPVGVEHGVEWKVLGNSDDWRYGGGMHGHGTDQLVKTDQGVVMGWPYALLLDIGPRSCYLLQPTMPKETPKTATSATSKEETPDSKPVAKDDKMADVSR